MDPNTEQQITNDDFESLLSPESTHAVKILAGFIDYYRKKHQETLATLSTLGAGDRAQYVEGVAITEGLRELEMMRDAVSPSSSLTQGQQRLLLEQLRARSENPDLGESDDYLDVIKIVDFIHNCSRVNGT